MEGTSERWQESWEKRTLTLLPALIFLFSLGNATADLGGNVNVTFQYPSPGSVQRTISHAQAQVAGLHPGAYITVTPGPGHECIWGTQGNNTVVICQPENGSYGLGDFTYTLTTDGGNVTWMASADQTAPLLSPLVFYNATVAVSTVIELHFSAASLHIGRNTLPFDCSPVLGNVSALLCWGDYTNLSLPGGAYKTWAEATDQSGNRAVTWKITHVLPTLLPLATGWNLISVPAVTVDSGQRTLSGAGDETPPMPEVPVEPCENASIRYCPSFGGEWTQMTERYYGTYAPLDTGFEVIRLNGNGSFSRLTSSSFDGSMCAGPRAFTCPAGFCEFQGGPNALPCGQALGWDDDECWTSLDTLADDGNWRPYTVECLFDGAGNDCLTPARVLSQPPCVWYERGVCVMRRGCEDA